MKARIRSAPVLCLSALFCVLACSSNPPQAASPDSAPEKGPPDDLAYLPTDEDLAAEEAAAKLAEERSQMHGYAQVELRRFTPEIRTKAKTLAETKYPDLKSAVTAALQGAHRVPQSAERDASRHPLETLEFFGLTPQMRVIEYLPGEGWYTEILAPTLAAQGKLYVTTTDPAGPPSERATLYAERLKLFLNKSDEVYGKVEPLVFDAENPQLKVTEPVDLVLVIRGFHGWVNRDQMDTWLSTISAALKEDGTLGIVQHRAKEDADPKESAKKGYVPEGWLIEQVEARGFRLDGKSEINKNEKDTKDYPEGVWALPPSLRLGEKDRQKYLAIGESDRMTLRFKKNSASPTGKN